MNTAQFLGLLRHSLTTVGGGLVTTGLTSDNLQLTAAGIVLGVIGGGWSFFKNAGDAPTSPPTIPNPPAPPAPPSAPAV